MSLNIFIGNFMNIITGKVLVGGEQVKLRCQTKFEVMIMLRIVEAEINSAVQANFVCLTRLNIKISQNPDILYG